MLVDLTQDWLVRAFVVFVRIGVMCMFMPFISIRYNTPRVRLFFAISLTILVVPNIKLPPDVLQAGNLISIIFIEVLYGVFIGLLTRSILEVLNLLGFIIGHSVGMVNAMVNDPISRLQSTLINSFLINLGLVMLLSENYHHLIISAMHNSYLLFPVGQIPDNAQDYSLSYVYILEKGFAVGLQLSAPFIVFSIIFQLSIGLFNRLSPNINIFFVSLPMQIIVGFTVFAIVLPTLMYQFVNFFEFAMKEMF